MSSTLAAAGSAFSAGVQSLVALAPASGPAANPSANPVTSVPLKASATVASPKAPARQATWSENAAEMALDSVLESAGNGARAITQSLSNAVDSVTTAVINLAGSVGTSVSGVMSSGLTLPATPVASPAISREQLQSAYLAGSQPALVSPAPNVSQNGDTPGLVGSGDPATPDQSSPDVQAVIGGNGTVYYVDFAAGNDGNSGKSASQARCV